MVCLEEEHHELGARMSSDYLTLLGFDSFFIGANTPKNEIVNAIETLQPDVVCISVTNYFHLTRLHTLTDMLAKSDVGYISKASTTDEKVYKLVVGGYAVHHSSNVASLVKADYLIDSFQDLVPVKEAFL